MLEKLQAFAGSKYDLQGDAVATYESQIGDAAEQLEALTITKRFVSTGAPALDGPAELSSEIDGDAAGLDRHDVVGLDAQSISVGISFEASAHATRIRRAQ